MIVITMTSCPPKLRGDLSKWLCEINTGVYVGQVNARVREALWQRVCANINMGQATMVYTAANEQRMEFRTHNSNWRIKDFDGIKLVMRPTSAAASAEAEEDKLSPGFSKAAKYRMARRKNRQRAEASDKYAFLDIETTGLHADRDKIIEIGVLGVEDGRKAFEWSRLVNADGRIPQNIVELTGISDEMLNAEGVDLTDALQRLNELIAGRTIVCYNSQFDMAFLQAAYISKGITFAAGRVIDLLPKAQRLLADVENYKLGTVAQYFGFSIEGQHRAMADCELLYQVFLKLNEN